MDCCGNESFDSGADDRCGRANMVERFGSLRRELVFHDISRRLSDMSLMCRISAMKVEEIYRQKMFGKGGSLERARNWMRHLI